MDFFDSLKTSSSDYAGGSNNIASMDFENGAMWAYDFLTRWRNPDVDGCSDVDTLVLLKLQKDGEFRIMLGYYRGDNYWVLNTGDVIPFGGLSVAYWRYL